MNNYEIYFELFGKKMKTTITAESEEDAKKILYTKIKFHKVIKKEGDAFNKSMDILDSIMDILDGKSKN